MSGKYIHLAPPPEDELHQNGKPYAQFDPKTIYLVEGADPIILGRASSKSVSRNNEADNGYLKVPSGQTALGREHASLCLRNGVLYIAMKERDGLIFHDSTHPRMLDRSSEFFPLRRLSRVRLGVNGAFSVNYLVDVIFDIADTDHWSSPVKKRFVRALPL
ncbi:hypothetical protein R3P38DRAFT_2918378 [Favolaschia claudopus]|uniref:FHA domain-containing protein n=1 Tax=Favolaschia claudopus TaxID=2862362 RepID=A0AAW0C1N0_9AGAR